MHESIWIIPGVFQMTNKKDLKPRPLHSTKNLYPHDSLRDYKEYQVNL